MRRARRERRNPESIDIRERRGGREALQTDAGGEVEGRRYRVMQEEVTM